MLISGKRAFLLMGRVCAKALGRKLYLRMEIGGGGNVVGGQRDRRVKCAGKREAGVMGCVI